MSDSQRFVADLLTSRRATIHDDEPTRGAGTGQSEQTALDELRSAIDAITDLRARDPVDALRVLRELLGDPALKPDDLDRFIEVWRTAVDNADAFEREMRGDVRGVADWWDRLRAYLHKPADVTDNDKQVLEVLAQRYILPQSLIAPPVNPHERMLETLDPAWVPLLKAKIGERWWPVGLREMPRHTAENPYVYRAEDRAGTPLPAGRPHDIGLFSDFGTGYYHSWGIAEQLAAWKFTHAFHLGDVYYAGREEEFKKRFQIPLEPVVKNTTFFGLAENHELYSGGEHYLVYFERLRKQKRTPQEGSYFCVVFPDHQIIAIDVNWQRRQWYMDTELRAWLSERIAAAGHRTNILLTGSAPFDYGGSDPRPLLGQLWEYVEHGEVGLWFWGDDHYCALFDKNDEVPFYGSCIGHGGYPGPVQPASLASWKTKPIWWENETRFPRWTNWRPDMTNNGWCHATLQPGGGVDLLYVDWLWCKRAAVSFARDDKGLKLTSREVFEREDHPQFHRPTNGGA